MLYSTIHTCILGSLIRIYFESECDNLAENNYEKLFYCILSIIKWKNYRLFSFLVIFWLMCQESLEIWSFDLDDQHFTTRLVKPVRMLLACFLQRKPDISIYIKKMPLGNWQIWHISKEYSYSFMLESPLNTNL